MGEFREYSSEYSKFRELAETIKAKQPNVQTIRYLLADWLTG